MHRHRQAGDKGEVTVINGDISIRARGGRPRHLAPIHYEDAPVLRDCGPRLPALPLTSLTLRGASMQQVKAKVLSCKNYRKTLWCPLVLARSPFMFFFLNKFKFNTKFTFRIDVYRNLYIPK